MAPEIVSEKISEGTFAKLGLREVVQGPDLTDRVVRALDRVVIDEQGGFLAGNAAALMIQDASLGNVDSDRLGWMGRAQVVFGLVDLEGRGWVSEKDCEALALAVLQGRGGDAVGPLKEFVEDIENEGMLQAAASGEAAEMMKFAEEGMLTLKGFSLWLAGFMDSLEEDDENTQEGKV